MNRRAPPSAALARKTASALHDGKLMHYAPQQGTYVYFRYDDKQKVMVVLNKNTSATTVANKKYGPGVC